MKVFVAEFLCGGGLEQADPRVSPSMLAEAVAMQSAWCQDAAKCAEVITILDPSCDLDLPSQVDCRRADSTQPMLPQWLTLAQSADMSFLIAPETNGILRTIVSEFRKQGISVIASDDSFLEATANKHAFAQFMHRADIGHPETMLLESAVQELHMQSAVSNQWVIKPIDGCGSSDISLVDTHSLCDVHPDAGNIVQPYILGEHVSIAAIVTENSISFLPAVCQNIDPVTLQYSGGTGPLTEDLHRRAKRIAKATLDALPGQPYGYIGFDLILRQPESEDVVIEVNPRLTTSYIGLRHLFASNLAEKMLSPDTIALQRCQEMARITWTSDGMVNSDE